MIERPRGTRDLLPEDMHTRNRFEETLRRTCTNFGYREILTPTFEHTKLFTEKSGPSIVEDLYAFKDKSGREIALRPEFTASVMRMYAQSLRERPKPLKLFYFGPNFRYERPQAGRYREFWQFGTELMGPDTPRADAENIALAYSCMRNSGLRDFQLKISHLGILETYLREKNVAGGDVRKIYHAIDRGNIEEIASGYGFMDELRMLLSADMEGMRDMVDDTRSMDHLQHVLNTLELYGINGECYTVDLSTVRGLDYYKGVVFEMEAESLGAEKQICGGGDYSLGDLFGVDISSKGFAIGFDRTLLALEKDSVSYHEWEPTCYLIPLGEGSMPFTYELLNTLRGKGIIADIELMERGVGKALAYADRMNFRYSVIIGEKEVEEGILTVKNMRSGEQMTMDKEELVAELEKHES